MSERYHHIDVSIMLDREDELYKRLSAAAEQNGWSVEQLVELLLSVGSQGLLEARFEAWERLRK